MSWGREWLMCMEDGGSFRRETFTSLLWGLYIGENITEHEASLFNDRTSGLW